MKHAPIILFVYNRPIHTAKTLKALAGNPEASDSNLIVYSDGPKDEQDQATVNEVRKIIDDTVGFRSVTLITQPENNGLAKSIIHGVTDTLRQNDSVIVLEDDILVSPAFLSYMNSSLERYAANGNVASIHGWNFPLKTQKIPETFFLRGADCWGWATWKRSWAFFQSDGKFLLSELISRNLTHSFDLDGAYPYTEMLRNQIAGKNNSWAIRWHASIFLRGMVTLHPGRSFVRNIGLDGSGVHSQADWRLETVLSDTKNPAYPETEVENVFMRGEIINHLRKKGKPGKISRMRKKCTDWLLKILR